jgi:solute carrier family 25 (mitochondrial citrate transporter), member 1
MAFDAIKNSLSDESGHLTFAQSMFAGMMAGATESVVAVTPTERLKTAMYDQLFILSNTILHHGLASDYL